MPAEIGLPDRIQTDVEIPSQDHRPCALCGLVNESPKEIHLPSVGIKRTRSRRM
jgi:hypothetical protein